MFSILGAAVGLSVANCADSRSLFISAIAWNIVTLSISLLVGGIMVSAFTAGENKVEAVTYGVIMWGFVFGVFMVVGAIGANSGLNGLVGLAQATQGTHRADWENGAREAGVSQELIEDWRRKAATAGERVNDPQTREEIRQAAKRTAWWLFGGIWISMIAAAFGGWAGAGPTFRLVPVAPRTLRL